MGFPFWVSLCILLVFCAYGGLQFAVFGWLTAKGMPRGALSIVFAPAALVAVEVSWPHLFPWRLGQTQLPLTPLVQMAEVTGVYGVSFLVLWGGAVGERLLRRIWPRVAAGHASPGEGRVVRAAGVWVVAMVLAVAFGVWRTREIERYLDARPPLRVGVVQPGVGDRERLRSCRSLSRDIEGRVDLLLWPESTVGRYSLDLREFRSRRHLAAESRDPIRPLANPRCFLICGGESYRRGASETGPFYSSAFLIDRDEKLIGRYHKRTLVPFGEVVPGEQWFPSLHRLSPHKSFLAPGTSAEPLTVPPTRPEGVRAGVLMCYEDLLAARARELAAAGASLLVNLTNDDWFGEGMAVPQHQQLAQLRTVETRRYLLRATTTGSTAVISPLGRVVAQAPFYEPAVLLENVHTLDIVTFYTRYGDVFGWACVLFVVGTVLRSWWRGRNAETN